jgi:hypothetical protein
MKYPTILVTGRTGRTGRAVAEMFDLDQLLAAMHGTQRAYCRPFFYDPYLIQSARPSQLPRRKQMSAGKSSIARNSCSGPSWSVHVFSGPWCETAHDDRSPRVQKGTQSMNQPNGVQEYGVTKIANWRRSSARKAAARKDRSCHLQLCSESV